MSLKNVDIESVLRRVAERRIEEAMREGKFDNLEGAGKPLDLEAAPAEENARMMWWALRILKQNDVVPDEVKWRKRVDFLRGELQAARDGKQVESLVGEINQLIKNINTLGTNAIALGMVPLDLDEELLRWANRQGGK